MALSLLYSAKRIEQQFHTDEIEVFKGEFDKNIQLCSSLTSEIIDEIPQEWNVPHAIIKEKIDQLFDDSWTKEVWNNFIECLNENLNNE